MLNYSKIILILAMTLNTNDSQARSCEGMLTVVKKYSPSRERGDSEELC
jgi:hypothetical protein